MDRPPPESLILDVARCMTLWHRNVVTTTETVGGLLDHFAFALLARPDADSAISETVDMLPAPLLSGSVERLARSRSSDGCWRWRPGGPNLSLPYPERITPTSTPPVLWGLAGPAEPAVLYALARLLQER